MEFFMKKNYRILFIGNSYTFYNKMPTEIFKKIAESEGYDLTVDSITKGGWTLEKHADPEGETGKRVAEALSPENIGKYDYVILQEQSIRPAREDAREQFYSAVRTLVTKIRAIGAEPILYSTWGRRRDNEKLAEFSMTNETMTYKLAAAYAKMGDELGIKVAHAGLAFYELYSIRECDINLYHHDGSHPSYAGSFLAALTVYSTVFGADARAVKYSGELTDGQLAVLADAAQKVTENPPDILPYN